MPSRGPALPADIERACSTRSRRSYREWIADPASAVDVSVAASTRPPTAAAAAADLGAVTTWIDAWRRTADRFPIEVTWVERRWPGFGTVTIPTHARVIGASAITTVGGCGKWWQQTLARVDAFLELGGDAPRLRAALAATAPRWAEWDDHDVERLRAVVAWFRSSQFESLFPRQVAVPGVDTKWLETRRPVVEELVEAARSGDDSSAGLGLLSPSERVRLRVLDDSIDLPLRDVEAPVEQVAGLWPAGGPENVLIVENLTTFLALPALPGTVAVFGRGFAVEALVAVPWLTRARRVRYWGDLDSHGFAILDRVRSRIPTVRSVLMDPGTLREWKELCVPEPKPTRAPLTRLDDDETSALEELTLAGDRRLEQERIPWDWVLPRLRAALA